MPDHVIAEIAEKPCGHRGEVPGVGHRGFGHQGAKRVDRGTFVGGKAVAFSGDLLISATAPRLRQIRSGASPIIEKRPRISPPSTDSRRNVFLCRRRDGDRLTQASACRRQALLPPVGGCQCRSRRRRPRRCLPRHTPTGHPSEAAGRRQALPEDYASATGRRPGC